MTEAPMRVLALFLPAAMAALLAAGCASVNPAPPIDVLPTEPPRLAPPAPVSGPATGSLFNAATYRPAMEDQRARFVGDLVTIEINETIDAKQNSQSEVARNGSNSGGITALPLVPASILGKASIGAGYESDFNGKGNTSSNNQFKSSVTAMVTEVLPNGNLVIAGEKQVGVNRSVDVLRFSGTIDPRHLRRGAGGHTGNVIDSQYVANVRVVSRGLGEQAEAQAMGWLARAFNSITPF
ncbi:flagellar basal body L-ring protein FlgH [Comamonas flocculans]|uniref:Flagellar basal body L-ring protein FlgH n=1 Tax=Comamonas flocculans TaxID=2597701 RepID=A0A5B8RV07_9BURK|nr:flagellar basal body L-ring protein FlgH [Comamonas flocculans]QEA12588.1 flagellar basal body L-ring protein FlgH [Comamonas flocculans]